MLEILLAAVIAYVVAEGLKISINWAKKEEEATISLYS